MEDIKERDISIFENEGYCVFNKLGINRLDDFIKLRKDLISLLKDYSEGEIVNQPLINNSFRFSHEFENSGIHYFGCPIDHRFRRGNGSVYKAENKNWLFGKHARLNLLNNPNLLWSILNQDILIDVAKKCLKTKKLSFLGAHLGQNYPGASLDDRSFFTTIGKVIQDRIKAYLFYTKPYNILTILVPLDDFNDSNSPIVLYPKTHQHYLEINDHIAKCFRESNVSSDYTFQPNIPHEYNDSFNNKFLGPYDKNLFFGNTLYRELLPQDLSKPKRLIAKKGDITIIDGRMLLEYGSNSSQDTTRFLILYFSNDDFPPYDSYARQNIRDLVHLKVHSRNNSIVYLKYSIVYLKYSVKNVIKYFLYKSMWFYQKVKNRLSNKLSISKPNNFQPTKITQKMHLNIGSGLSWNHDEVIGLDIGEESEVNFDLESNEPLPFSDNRFNGVYTSHNLEHLRESTVIKILEEVYRIIKPGGVLRIVVPDIIGFFDAYEKRNIAYFDWIRRKHTYRYDSWLRLIVRSFAEPVVDKYSDEDLYSLYNKMNLFDFLNKFTEEVNILDEKKLLGPNNHKSWHSYDKFNSILSKIGFTKVIEMSHFDSHLEVFKSSDFKQTRRNGPDSIQRVHQSLFVEGIK